MQDRVTHLIKQLENNLRENPLHYKEKLLELEYSLGHQCLRMKWAAHLQLWKEGQPLNHTRMVGWHAHIFMHAYLHED